MLPLVQNAIFVGRKDKLDYLNSVVEPKRKDNLSIVSISREKMEWKSHTGITICLYAYERF